jgi:hypothetical protein
MSMSDSLPDVSITILIRLLRLASGGKVVPQRAHAP